MKKFAIVIISLFALFTFTACDGYTIENNYQLAKNGRIVSVCGEQVEVNVGGEVFEFEGTNYHVGQEVKVFFDTNGEPTNPWVWWVIDCKPLH